MFKQARSERTYTGLLTSAARLFAELGYDATQTPQIAREAGVATGAFYRYFDDKRQTFLEVMELRLAQLMTDIVGELSPARLANPGSPRDSIDTVLGALFTHVRKHAALQRVFLSMSYRDADVMAMRIRFESQGIEVLSMAIENMISREVVPHARAAAVVILATVLEIAADSTGIMPARSRGVGEEELRVALREMIYRYLYPSG